MRLTSDRRLSKNTWTIIQTCKTIIERTRCGHRQGTYTSPAVYWLHRSAGADHVYLIPLSTDGGRLPEMRVIEALAPSRS